VPLFDDRDQGDEAEEPDSEGEIEHDQDDSQDLHRGDFKVRTRPTVCRLAQALPLAAPAAGNGHEQKGGKEEKKFEFDVNSLYESIKPTWPFQAKEPEGLARTLVAFFVDL
jgi:hypothetical protein